jgi:hypothetical protein
MYVIRRVLNFNTILECYRSGCKQQHLQLFYYRAFRYSAAFYSGHHDLNS